MKEERRSWRKSDILKLEDFAELAVRYIVGRNTVGRNTVGSVAIIRHSLFDLRRQYKIIINKQLKRKNLLFQAVFRLLRYLKINLPPQSKE